MRGLEPYPCAIAYLVASEHSQRGQWPPYRTVQLQCRHPVVPKPGCISEAHTVTIAKNISHQKRSMELPQKLEMELPYDPVIPLLGYNRRKLKH